MSRRIKPEKREVPPDVRYNNTRIQMMINRIMLNGKKSTVTSLVYDAIDMIAAKTGKDGVEVFEQALKKRQPCHGSPPASCWRRHLSGANGGLSRTTADPWLCVGSSALPARALANPSPRNLLLN